MRTGTYEEAGDREHGQEMADSILESPGRRYSSGTLYYAMPHKPSSIKTWDGKPKRKRAAVKATVLCFFRWPQLMLLVSEGTQGHLPPQRHSQVGLSGCYLHPSDRPAGRMGLEGRGSTGGQWRLPGGWGWEARSTRGWASPTDPVQGENASYSKQGEAGGWDVSHLASRSRWGWS